MSNKDDKTPKTQTGAEGQPPKSPPPTIALELGDGLPPPQNVLLVDDDKSQRTLLTIMLKRASSNKVSIAEAESATEALQVLETFKEVDTIIVDYMLPGMNGLELIRHLREKPELADVRIIMLSARGDKGAHIEASDAGADAYILKPIPIQDMSKWFED